MKDIKNYIIAGLTACLALSVFLNVKSDSGSNKPTPYHESATIALQTCMNFYTSQTGVLRSQMAGWASTTTRQALIECNEFVNALYKDK